VLFSLIFSCRNKPKKAVKIYRAVPHKKSPEQEIAGLEKQKAYIMKNGRLPTGVDTNMNPSKYYEHISDVIKRIQKYQVGKTEEKSIMIKPGDWVTIERRYAVEHGKAALNGEYKILSKTVKASELYTDGNSLYEWGWNP